MADPRLDVRLQQRCSLAARPRLLGDGPRHVGLFFGTRAAAQRQRGVDVALVTAQAV
jgi:hypothetical protein